MILGNSMESLFLEAEKIRGTEIAAAFQIGHDSRLDTTVRAREVEQHMSTARAQINELLVKGVELIEQKIELLDARDNLAALERAKDTNYYPLLESLGNLVEKVVTRNATGLFEGDADTLKTLFEQFENDKIAVNYIETRFPGIGKLIAPDDITGKPQTLLDRGIRPLFNNLMRRYGALPNVALKESDIELPEFERAEAAAFILVLKELGSFETADFETACDKIAQEYPNPVRLGAESIKWRLQTWLAYPGRYPNPQVYKSYDEMMQANGYTSKKEGE